MRNHGSTLGGASLGGMSAMHEQMVLPVPGIEHIEQPYYFELGGDLSPDEFGLQQGPLAGAKNSADRTGESGCLHWRTGAGRGRRDHSARQLLA